MDAENRKLGATAATVACATVAGLLATVTLSGFVRGRSARAQSVIALLWVTGRRRKFETLDQLEAAIAHKRAESFTWPPKSLRLEGDVSEERHRGACVFHVLPKGSKPKGKILYIHRGGYVFDLVRPHWKIIGALAKATGAKVVVPIYPLAPEATFRQGYALMEDLWLEITREGMPVAMAGDSAGGGLTMALAQCIRNADLKRPAGLLLFSPWLDVQIDEPLQVEIQPHDPMLYATGLRKAGALWAAGEDPRSPEISPIYGEMKDLPPVAIFTGSSDILMADARRLRDRLAAVGAPAEYHEYQGMFHVWVGAPVPEGRKALSQAGAFLT